MTVHPTISPQELDELEMLVDRHGLPAVLEMLAHICEGKAEHVAVNWQDARTTKVWEASAELLADMAATHPKGVTP